MIAKGLRATHEDRLAALVEILHPQTPRPFGNGVDDYWDEKRFGTPEARQYAELHHGFFGLFSPQPLAEDSNGLTLDSFMGKSLREADASDLQDFFGAEHYPNYIPLNSHFHMLFTQALTAPSEDEYNYNAFFRQLDDFLTAVADVSFATYKDDLEEAAIVERAKAILLARGYSVSR